MEKINYSIPAYLSDFSSSEDGRTTAKLKVFYIGETADGRVFDEDMANKLASTLPYCPVVAFYSDVKKDFLGHNGTQYIYGLVRPDAKHKFEKDKEGNNWLMTEVMLYTDRIDNIGAVAKKIVGQPQSMELDPKTAKYEFFKDESTGKTKIKFTDGSLIGLSVLGTDQKPAFTGSEFFMVTEFSEMRERFENFFSCLEEQSRGVKMDKTVFESYANFVKLSYNEQMNMAQKAMETQLGETALCCVSEMTDAKVTFAILDLSTFQEDYKRYSYNISEQGVEFGEEEQVFRKFVSLAELNYLEGMGKASVQDTDVTNHSITEVTIESTTPVQANTETEVTIDPVATDCGCGGKDNKEDAACGGKPKTDAGCGGCPNEPEDDDPDDDDDDIEDKKEKKGCGNCSEGDLNEQTEETQENINNNSSLSDSERAELETYRKAAKISLIDSYATMLDDATLESFKAKVDELDFTKLESDLALAYVKVAKTQVNSTKAATAPVTFTVKPVDKPMDYASIVRGLLNKE